MIKSRFTLKQLEALVFVVDTGTFRAAAEALGTTQPNISARIAALESALETRLLTRDAGSVRLTQAGGPVLERARAVLWAGEALLEEAGRRDLVEERLRLGVTELVACTWLREFLRRLKSDYPGLRVALEVDLSTVIDQRLIEGQLDLAFQTGPFAESALTVRPLGREAYCWVARPDLVAGLGADQGLEALFQHTILTHAKHTQAGQALHALARQRGLDSARIVHSSALSACLPMVQEGLGVALLPEALVRGAVDRGELCVLDSDWLPDPLIFGARFEAQRAPRFVAKAAEIAQQAAQAPLDH